MTLLWEWRCCAELQKEVVNSIWPQVRYSDRVEGLLMILFAIYLSEPLVHHGVFIQKRLLELLASDVYGIGGLPVSLAVAEDKIHVRQELLVACVLIVVHFALYRAKIHGCGDLRKVVGYVVGNRINWLLEGTNETCPKP